MRFLQARGFLFKPTNKRRVVTNKLFSLYTDKQYVACTFILLKAAGSVTEGCW